MGNLYAQRCRCHRDATFCWRRLNNSVIISAKGVLMGLAIDEIEYDGKSMVCETDIEGRYTFVNRKFIEQNGYAREALLGQTSNMMRHPDMPKCLFSTMWRALKAGENWKGYMKNRAQSGKFYWVVLYISSKYDDAGKLTGYSGVYKKINEAFIPEIQARYAAIFENERCGKEVTEIVNLASEEEIR